MKKVPNPGGTIGHNMSFSLQPHPRKASNTEVSQDANGLLSSEKINAKTTIKGATDP